MKFRNLLQSEMRSWFSKNDFISFDAPILTPVPLYEDDSAIKAGLSKQNVFMTQCV
jgi:aspartyl/asparaginyl-tRNA synthetase